MYNDSDRLLMERETFFNVNSRDDNNNIYKRNTQELNFADDQNIGEITGEIFNTSEIDQGMPLRSNKLDKKTKDFNDNPFTDFELYNQRSSLNISYHDPTNNDYIADPKYADLNSANKLLGNITPEQRLSSVINLFSWNFYKMFTKNTNNKSMLISPFSLITNMIILYKGSKGVTEENLRNFFSFSHKEETIQSMFKINRKITDIGTCRSTNLLLFPNNLVINRAFFNYIANMGIIENIDLKNQYVNQYINKYIENASGGLSKEFFKSPIIKNNTNIISVSSIIYYSMWKYKFDKINSAPFYGTNQRMEQMMYLYNRELLYFENNNNIVIELDFYSNNNTDFAFGIIASKSNGINMQDIDDNLYGHYIANLKMTRLGLVCFPKFKQENKYKSDNLFKQAGLTDLFINANLSEIVINNSIQYVTDIVHHCTLVIDEKGADTNPSSVVGSNNIIINKPFLYYIRYKPLNNIILIGKYV